MSENISDLEERLALANNDHETIDALNELAYNLPGDEIERRITLSQRALTMSSAGKLAAEPYARGQAASLSILGDIAIDVGNYREALIMLLRSQTLLENLDEPAISVRILLKLGWVYFNFGDYPKAFECLWSGEKTAREKGLAAAQADCLNSLGAVYGESGDYQQSAESLNRALQILEEIGDQRKVCTVLNNLAFAQLGQKDFETALVNANRSVVLAAELNANTLLSLTHGTCGQIYLALKNFRTAERFLLMAQLEHQKVYNQPDDELVLDLARISLELGRLKDARRMLLASLKSVEYRGVQRFRYQFYALLAELCERENDLPQALAYYKQFHEIKASVFNEQTQNNLGNMMAVQQAETWRIDTAIYRLKNRSLRRQASAHSQAVVELQHLATTDALTRVMNRRHFYILADYAFRAAQESRLSLSALMLDLDDFKIINDTFGHLAGDQVLAEIAAVMQGCLRGNDHLARIGGDEFSVLVTESTQEEAQKIGLRILQKVERYRVSISGQAVGITVSIGAAQMAPSDFSLQDLLTRADQALYRAKQAGKACLFAAPHSIQPPDSTQNG